MIYDDFPPFMTIPGKPSTFETANGISKVTEGTMMVVLEIVVGEGAVVDPWALSIGGAEREAQAAKALKVCLVPTGVTGWLHWDSSNTSNDQVELIERRETP